MDLTDPEKLKQLVAALAPGLIILWMRQWFIAGPTPSFQDRALSYAAVSAVYYAVFTPLTDYLEKEHGLRHWFANALEYAGFPVLIGAVLAVTASNDLLGRLLRGTGLQPVHHIPAAWDYAFSRLRGQTYVIVTLTDGSQVAGHYGSGSFASSNNSERDLLIEDVWEIAPDGTWARPPTERSILLCGKDIRSVELLRT